MKKIADDIGICEQRLNDLEKEQSKTVNERRILTIQNINGEAWARRSVKMFDRECLYKGIAQKKANMEKFKNNV